MKTFYLEKVRLVLTEVVIIIFVVTSLSGAGIEIKDTFKTGMEPIVGGLDHLIQKNQLIHRIDGLHKDYMK